MTVAQSGWQALSLLRREEFAFLISDVRMPGMSGVELAARARKMPHAPLVILTSALDLDIADGIAEHFMPKPIDVTHLHEVLVHDLERQERHLEAKAA